MSEGVGGSGSWRVSARSSPHILRTDLGGALGAYRAGRENGRGGDPPYGRNFRFGLDGFQERGMFDLGVDLVTARLFEVVTFTEHAVEFIHQE